MDNQSLFSRILLKIGLAILTIALVDLVYINYLVLKQSQRIEENTSSDTNSQSESRTITGESPAAEASPETSQAASPSPSVGTNGETVVEKETIVEKQTVVQTAQKEIFIPLGDGTTAKNSYTNLTGAQVTIDSSNYPGISKAYFEASVSVVGGNGKGWVQLYNSTAGRPVWFSEVSTSSGSPTALQSSPISLEKGQNTYVVQAKTDLTEFTVIVSGARIHIILK